MCPGKERKLAKIILLDEREDKPNKPNDVHGEGDESVISDEEGEEVHIVDENTKLCDQGLPIKEIVGGDKKIPGERSEPGKVVHLVNSVANVDDLSKTLKQSEASGSCRPVRT